MLNNTFNIKKNIQFYLQNYKTHQSSLNGNGGFTLIELLVATAIMSGVLTIAGIGIVAMLKQNSKQLSDSDRRANLSRALDYIANEVRMANTLAATSSSLPSDATGVLRLTIPSDTTYPNHEYYIKPVNTACATTAAPTSVLWASPNMICRRLIPATGSPSDDILVDGVTSGGFTATRTSNNRQVALTLTGAIKSVGAQAGTLQVTTTVAARAQ